MKQILVLDKNQSQKHVLSGFYVESPCVHWFKYWFVHVNYLIKVTNGHGRGMELHEMKYYGPNRSVYQIDNTYQPYLKQNKSIRTIFTEESEFM